MSWSEEALRLLVLRGEDEESLAHRTEQGLRRPAGPEGVLQPAQQLRLLRLTRRVLL